MSGETMKVSGTFTSQPDANTSLKFPPAEASGYYLPVKITGQKGQAIKRISNKKINVFGETNDGDDYMNLIVAVKQESPKIEFKLYENKSNALSDIGGETFYIDCTGCTFN